MSEEHNLAEGRKRPRNTGEALLIEATCNQVNHRGGYTGMTPAAFRAFVDGSPSGQALARRIALSD